MHMSKIHVPCFSQEMAQRVVQSRGYGGATPSRQVAGFDSFSFEVNVPMDNYFGTVRLQEDYVHRCRHVTFESRYAAPSPERSAKLNSRSCTPEPAVENLKDVVPTFHRNEAAP